MIGNRYAKKHRSKDEGEKPFWISFADLMTALMTLFLVVMAVSSVMYSVVVAVSSVWPWVPKPNRTSDTCRWGVVA